MRTLYIRNVPDDVAERLEQLADRQAISVNALVNRNLAQLAKVADNARILDALPDLGPVDVDEVVRWIHEGRAERFGGH